jgi:hypothetical protein
MFVVDGMVTSLTVDSYGDPVRIVAARVPKVQVVEHIAFDPQQMDPPQLGQTLSDGHLMLDDSVCNENPCDVSYTVAVPFGVSVTVSSGGGPIDVSGVAGANLNSYGADVIARQIAGPLTVSTGGGHLLVSGLTGPLSADTNGSDMVARDVSAATATVVTGGGNAMIGFTAPPEAVLVSTDSGAATLAVPGGPYAINATDDGGGTSIRVPASATARSTITVISGGGFIAIRP